MDTGPDALDPFEVFLQSITYRLFPILLLVYILTLIVLDREWGPLYGVEVAFIAKMDQQAEARERRSHSRRQRSTSSVTTSSRQLSTDSTDVEHGVKHAAENVNNGGLIPANAHSGVDGLQGSTVDSCVNEDGDDVEDAAVGANPAVEPEKNVPKRAVNAILPFGIVIVLTFVGMYMNGADTLLVSRIFTAGQPLLLYNSVSINNVFTKLLLIICRNLVAMSLFQTRLPIVARL